MEEEFELILKTPRVTMARSYSVGDCYRCGNDEAWSMLNDNLAELVGDNQPQKPQRIIEMEQKAEAERKAAEVELYPESDHGEESEPEDGPAVCRDPEVTEPSDPEEPPKKKGKKK